jgi:hypothetical protein
LHAAWSSRRLAVSRQLPCKPIFQRGPTLAVLGPGPCTPTATRRALAALLGRWERALMRQHAETPLEVSSAPGLMHLFRVLGEVRRTRGVFWASMRGAGKPCCRQLQLTSASTHDLNNAAYPCLYLTLRRASWPCTDGTILRCWQCWSLPPPRPATACPIPTSAVWLALATARRAMRRQQTMMRGHPLLTEARHPGGCCRSHMGVWARI